MNLVIIIAGAVFAVIAVLIFIAVGGFSLMDRGTTPLRKASKMEDIVLHVPGYGDGVVENCETLAPGLGHYTINFGGLANPRIEYRQFYDKQIKSPTLRQRICGNPKYEVIAMYDPTNEKLIQYGGKKNDIPEERIGEEQQVRAKLAEARGEVERIRGEPLRQFNRILDSLERIKRSESGGFYQKRTQ